MRKYAVTLMLSMMFALLPARAFAWGAPGHRLVCRIAWERMTPAARTMVQQLLADDSASSFAESCVWADAVRRTSHPETYPYHFTNVPLDQDGMDWSRDCAPDRRCVTWAVLHYAGILRDAAQSHVARQEALKFLAHFVGDLHQPLHAVGDRGGNGVAVDFFGNTGKPERPNNLHAVWDSEILARAGIRGDSATAQALSSEVQDAEAAAWSAIDPEAWTNESFRIARDVAYGRLPANHVIGNAYYLPALGYERAQLMKAGVRLAAILNAVADGTLELPEHT